MVVSEPLTRRLWLEQSFTGIIPSDILEDIDVSSACKWWSERQVSASTDLWLMIRRRNNEQDDGWVRRSNSETIFPNLWPGLMTHEELPSSRTRKLLEYLNTFYTPNERRNLFTRVETCHWGLAVQWLNGFFFVSPQKCLDSWKFHLLRDIPLFSPWWLFAYDSFHWGNEAWLVKILNEGDGLFFSTLTDLSRKLQSGWEHISLARKLHFLKEKIYTTEQDYKIKSQK